MRSPTSSNESRSAKIVERSGPNSENYLERDALITLVRSSKNITPQNRIKLNQIWTDGFGVIHRAVLDNDLELLTSLLAQEDLKINLLSESQSNTPAHIAANVDNAEIIAKLMEREADLSIRNRQGYTPLGCAVRFGNTNVVKKILRSVHDRDSAIKAGLIDDGLIDLATAAISNNHVLRLAISSEEHIDHDKDSGFDLIREKLKEIGFSTPQKELNNLAKLAAEARALKILANLLQRDGALAVNITSNLLRGGVEEIVEHHQPFEDIALSIMEEARKTLRPNANSEKIFTNLGGKIC
jgi:ankyrin repeat protein